MSVHVVSLVNFNNQALAGKMDAEAAARAFGLPGDHAGSNIRKRVQRVRKSQEEEKPEKEQVAKCMRCETTVEFANSWKPSLLTPKQVAQKSRDVAEHQHAEDVAYSEASQEYLDGKVGKGPPLSSPEIAKKYAAKGFELSEKKICRLGNSADTAGKLPLRPGPKSKVSEMFYEAGASFARVSQVAGSSCTAAQIASVVQSVIAGDKKTSDEFKHGEPNIKYLTHRIRQYEAQQGVLPISLRPQEASRVKWATWCNVRDHLDWTAAAQLDRGTCSPLGHL